MKKALARIATVPGFARGLGAVSLADSHVAFPTTAVSVAP
jgi:hypothetical protein